MSPEHVTSLTLLERIRAKDDEAWRRLHHLYTPLILYWCRHWGIDGADADDVRQEVFQAVAVGFENFRRDRPGDTFRGWLRGVTRNKLLDLYRRRRNTPSAEGGTDAQLRFQELAQQEAPLEEEPQEQVTGLYQRALDLVRSEFEEQTWQAFWRAAVDGHAPADIAADMGISAAGVRKAKSRVLRRLRDEVGDLLA
jgi:RNA polymerase sigma-70 factor (ECF subfamily)